jgi:hypothetical protein
MADVAISSLPVGTPSGNALLPYSTGASTLAVSLSSLENYKPIFSGSITDGNYTTASSLRFNVIHASRGDWYNAATGKFTAPIDGNIRVSSYCLIGAGGGAGYSQADLYFRINETAVVATLGAGTYWNTVVINTMHSVKNNDVLDFYGPNNIAGGGYIFGGGYNSFSIEYI